MGRVEHAGRDAPPGPRAGAGAALRAFAVMSGGMVVLVLGAIASIAIIVIVAVDGRVPPWPSLVGAGLLVAYLGAFRPWTRRWGASRDEITRALPGDEQIERPGLRMTRAITIDAPPEQVWPWIAQIGQDRGGFYSYTWLENFAGCRMRNADRIHPEWQHREVGDTVLLHPATGLPLTRFEPSRSYALGGWYFALEPTPDGRTRLLARTRVPRGLASIAYAIFVELPHFIMERKMLLNLRRLAAGGGG